MKQKLFTFMIFSFLSSLLSASPMELGTPAPALSVTDHHGATIDLGAELSEGTALVFFYPKALTPGCTKQACSLRDGWSELQARHVKVFGVSSDTAETQTRFRDKHELPYTLIADTEKIVSNAFGRSPWSRQAYLFQNGKLVWFDLKASTSDQANDVLAALDGLEK
jgi:thioredoxin-dependent peroxiredoxin